MEEKLKQLNVKLEADKDLAEKMISLETAEEVQNFLKAQGLEFSVDEINALKAALIKNAQQGELDDAELEEVAGGVIATATIVGLTASAIGGSCGGATFVHNITRGRW